MSDVYQSLAHSKWDCKYHVVFVPKRRGTGTTTTTPRHRLTRSGSRCPTLEKPPSESPAQRRKRVDDYRLEAGRCTLRLKAA